MLRKLMSYSLATWIGSLITFILIPLASHLYPSHELGVINYYYSVINILFTFILLGLDQSYLRFYSEYNKQEQKVQFTKNITITVFLVFFICLLSLPFFRKISLWLVDKETISIIVVILIHTIGLIITRYFVILYRLQSSLIKYTVLSVINTILLKSVYIFAFPIKPNAHVGIIMTGRISFIIAVLLFIIENKVFLFDRLFLVDKNLVNALRYSLPLVPTMAFAVLNNNIPQIILRSNNNFSNIAIFSIGVTLASIITLFHNGINTFLEPFIFKNYQSNQKIISNILNLFTVLAYLLCMVVVLFQDLFFFIFKKDYIISTQFLPFLLCSSLWYTIGDFYNIGVKICKRTRENIIIYLIGFFINLVLSMILVFKFDCVGAAVSSAISSAVISVLKTIKGNKYYKTINNYNNIIVGAVILIVIAFGNLVFWESSWKYCFSIFGIIFYTIYTRIYKEIFSLLKTKSINI